MSLYLSSQIILVLLTFGLLYLLIWGLQHAFTKLNFSKAKKRKLLYFITTGLSCWLGILTALAFLGYFTNFDAAPPRIFLAVFPSIILILGLLSSKAFFSVIAQVPPSWLVYVQAFRIVVELVLWMGLLAGFVPFQMTFVGFNFDIVVGITALMAGFVFFAAGPV